VTHPGHNFAIHHDGLWIDGTFVGATFMTQQAEPILGLATRTENVVIERKVERVMCYYDDDGFGHMHCLLCGKVVTLWLNLAPYSVRATRASFTGRVSVDGLPIMPRMTVGELLSLGLEIKQTLRADLSFRIGNVGVWLHGKVPRRAGPKATIQLQQVAFDFDHAQVAPYRSCIG
jgi:hypothetical protein